MNDGLVVLGGLLAACLMAASAWALVRLGPDPLKARIRRVAAPMTEGADTPEAEAVRSVFRTERRRAGLWDRIEARYPLLEGPRAAGTAACVTAGTGVGLWMVLRIVLRIPAGPELAAGLLGAMVAACYGTLAWLQARQAKKFTEQFPDVVDQIVQLSRTGIPPLEAVSSVMPDTAQPTRGVLEAVHDRLAAGLDADRTMKAVATRVRIPEFTLFCAVLRLQRRAGGKVSEALGNLSRTLRERRKTALKAHSSTAQTRLTLLVLALLPVVVLVMQKFTSPGSIDILLDTPSGLTVLRLGIGLIALGLAAAYVLGARAAR